MNIFVQVCHRFLCNDISTPQVPVAMFGGSGNYASALYIAAAKAKALDKVESELIDFVSATTKASTFTQFMKDLAVPADIRVKALNEICAQAKFSEVTKNFLGIIVMQILFMIVIIFFLFIIIFFHVICVSCFG